MGLLRWAIFGLVALLMTLLLAVFVLGNLDLSPPLWFVTVALVSWLGLAALMWRQRLRWWLVALIPLVWAGGVTLFALQFACRYRSAAGVLAACFHS